MSMMQDRISAEEYHKIMQGHINESETRNIGLSQFRDIIQKAQYRIENDLTIADCGLSVYSPNGSVELSPGCQICKKGTWLCIKIGNDCNANCSFCSQLRTPWRTTGDNAFENMWMHDVKQYAEQFAGQYVDGVAYTGGEPLLHLEKIIEVATHIKERAPTVYQWIYTNGILANEAVFKKLMAAGISELRFNLAATDFNKHSMEKMRSATAYFDRVTVEVPAILSTYHHLIEEEKLCWLPEFGASQLNLGELMLTTPWAWEVHGQETVYTYKEAQFGPIRSPAQSRRITYQIMQYAHDKKIPLLINDCSNDAKYLQSMKLKTNPSLLAFINQSIIK